MAALVRPNCVALLNVTQVVLPYMLAAKRGTIVNVSSIAGKNLYAGHMAYCGTKFAVHAMSEQMRRESQPETSGFVLSLRGWSRRSFWKYNEAGH